MHMNIQKGRVELDSTIPTSTSLEIGVVLQNFNSKDGISDA